MDGRGELETVFFFRKKDLFSGFRKTEKWSNRQLDKIGFYELETSAFKDMRRFNQLFAILREKTCSMDR